MPIANSTTPIWFATEHAATVGLAEDALSFQADLVLGAARARTLQVITVTEELLGTDPVNPATTAIGEVGAADVMGAALPALAFTGEDLATLVVEANVCLRTTLTVAELARANAAELVVADLVEIGAGSVAKTSAAVILATELGKTVRNAAGLVQPALAVETDLAFSAAIPLAVHA